MREGRESDEAPPPLRRKVLRNRWLRRSHWLRDNLPDLWARAALALAIVGGVAVFFALWSFSGLNRAPREWMALDGLGGGLWLYQWIRPRDELIARWYSEHEDAEAGRE